MPMALDRQNPDHTNQNANMNRNNWRNNNEAHGSGERPHTRHRVIGFGALEEIAQSDDKEIFTKIYDKKETFMEFLESSYNGDKVDLYVLVMKIISKVCQSSFDNLKHTLLLQICNSKFMGTLRSYLMDLPYMDERTKSRNRLYWTNQQEFWECFVTFSECVIDISPATALQRCRSLIEATSESCLRGLHDRHGFTLPPEYTVKLAQLIQRLTKCEKNEMETEEQVRRHNLISDDAEPPECFRQLSVVPRGADLVGAERPFVRAAVARGAYRDTEHYLDVQFRLLREDCFGPLREGILQYIEDPNRKKFDYIRVFHNVKFVEPYISKGKIGTTIELDEKTKKRQMRVNWAHSKRFIFGCLLLFTKDNCQNFITATILDRDSKMLNEGKIPVSIVDMIDGNIIYNNASYIMIESEVYFEPYFHVLKALQDPKFPEHLAMSKYIVHVDPVPRPPSHVLPDTAYGIQTEHFDTTKFRVLDDSTWPTKEQLGLNESQYDAYKLALTHEFAVIQGPPGTGKTFLGVKIAKTLIENVKSDRGACLMLVICYTNHALDQFLEAILPVTQSIVRIGGRSRNEAMEKINLATLRKTVKVDSTNNRLYHEHRHNVKRAVLQLQQAQAQLDALSNSVIGYYSLQAKVPESEVLGKYYSDRRPGVKSDPLTHWLFEQMQLVDFRTVLMEETEEQNTEVVNNVDGEINERGEFVLDDFEEDDEEEITFLNERISTTFLIKDAENKLRTLILMYKHCDNRHKKYEIQREIVELKSRITSFREMSANRNRETPYHLHEGVDPSRVPMIDRWSLYFRWTNILMNQMKEDIKPLQKQLESANTAYEESRIIVDLHILRGIKVVGMTTSGAARLRKLLQTLAPPIVIAEEAAEVLEQHIVTSLTKNCKHLILIGDHQQLRPSAAYVRLARRYNLEVSLFERAVANALPARRLRVQHRMRPELAALLAPHIYEDLANHASVEHFPPVRGVTADLFFLSHDYKEEQVEDGSSRRNPREGELALRLARYLLQQGYEPGDVTILAAYSGQMFYMKKQREAYGLTEVKITVVDNYQGEESKIIVLSLVRNNAEGRIGFLGTANRVCVALSRAREGFYILGNIDILKRNSDLWKKIAGTLETSSSLGTSLVLKCENHASQFTVITSPEDFEKVPEGGCLLKCDGSLPACGHRCPRVCHGYDRGHLATTCYLKCERVLCELGHVCPLKCFEKCDPCGVPVRKVLPCGHGKCVPCHAHPADPSLRCLTRVTVTLPDCGHEAKKPCHQDVAQVRCAVRCGARVACGHVCRLACHVTEDPDHERYKCQKPCARAKRGCAAGLAGDRGDHQCPYMCYEECAPCTVEVVKKRSSCKHSERVPCHADVGAAPCRKRCARVLQQCGHFCKKKCHEPCGDCEIIVKKIIPECGHEVEVMCKVEAGRALCGRACGRALPAPCGHACARRCASPCDPARCTRPARRALDSPCGHQVVLPCNVYNSTELWVDGKMDEETLMRHCGEPCGAEVACGHACGGACARCRRGRAHAPCTRTCHQTNICGHQCQEPCNQACPPCKMPCEVRCPHSRCPRPCGAPCVVCQEPCQRACPHGGACTRRCGEPCSRAACDAPCPAALPCGHRCRGLCGEPCPEICNTCRPDHFPRDFLGDEYQEDDKFVQLQDCPHVLDVDNLDNLMMGDAEAVSIRACPFCRKPIINTSRYKDFVNNMLKTEINTIKERVYGNDAVIKARGEQLSLDMAAFVGKRGDILKENADYKEAFDKLKANSIGVTVQKKVSLLQLEMQFQYLNILDMVGECYQRYKAANVTELKDDFLDVVKLICSALTDKTQKISLQLQMDISNEIKRLNSIIQLSRIVGHGEYRQTQNQSKVGAAKRSVLTRGVYVQNNALIALKELEEAVKLSGVVTREERELIVRAMESKAGSWFKCPNGHIYSISHCGGAMEVSRCADCGVPIGGTRHTLLPDNRHAGEVDGSRHAAWSNAYNNMANFNLHE